MSTETKKEIDEKFIDLLNVDTIKECENYITDLFRKFIISYETYSYYLGIITGYEIGFSMGVKSST